MGLESELRPTGATRGWATWELTGRARATCRCGLDTGWISRPDVITTARAHECAAALP